MNSLGWKDEFAAMSRAEQKSVHGSSSVDWDKILPVRFSDLLECIDIAMRTPDVWQAVSDFASRPPVDPGVREPNDPEVDARYRVVGLVGDFTEWYRRKKQLQDDPTSYAGLTRIPEDIARGGVSREDLVQIRACFRSPSIVDDVKLEAGN